MDITGSNNPSRHVSTRKRVFQGKYADPQLYWKRPHFERILKNSWFSSIGEQSGMFAPPGFRLKVCPLSSDLRLKRWMTTSELNIAWPRRSGMAEIDLPS
jgi:hypothetical protein